MSNKSDDLIRLKTVLNRTGLSRSVLYQSIKDKNFPRQIKISGSRTSVWSNNAISEWIEEQKQKAGVSNETA